jgi:hypothetical protein
MFLCNTIAPYKYPSPKNTLFIYMGCSGRMGAISVQGFEGFSICFVLFRVVGFFSPIPPKKAAHSRKIPSDADVYSFN